MMIIIPDDDDALDCIMFKEVGKEVGVPRGCAGCFGVMLMVRIPVTCIVGLVKL
jgi:hypothetical protein